jgi:hypothetical protein
VGAGLAAFAVARQVGHRATAGEARPEPIVGLALTAEEASAPPAPG